MTDDGIDGAPPPAQREWRVDNLEALRLPRSGCR